MDPQILLFRRQYFQLFEPDFLMWPPKSLLKEATIQAWLYSNLFDNNKNAYLPAQRYQFRVIKPLVKKIEISVNDPENDEINDDLMNHLSILISSELPGELTAVQQKSFVTFSCLPPDMEEEAHYKREPTITLLERRNLISGSFTTGFRTWEAALHLGSFLLSQKLIRDRSVMELGAGTGFLTVLAAKHLGAKHVTATDGDEGVVDALKENLFLNGLDDDRKVITSVLRWGHGLKGTWVEEESEEFPYDMVLGSDVTYDSRAHSALVGTLRMLFDLRPQLQVLISTAVRSPETFEKFKRTCLRSKFVVEEIDFVAKPIRQQTSLFYATAVPLTILSITRYPNDKPDINSHIDPI